MTRFHLLFLLCLTFSESQAQQIIWEKNFGWIGGDQITAICQTSDGGYLGTGLVSRYGSNFATGATVVKFNASGDTVFVKKLNFYCQSWGLPYIGSAWNGNYFVVVNVQFETGPFQYARFPAILEISEAGEVVQAKLFPQQEFCIITGVKKTKDEGLLLSGYKGSLNVSHTDSMFALKVNFLLEQEWAYKYSNLANAFYRGQHLEPMANGNHLVSGALGKRIYGHEIDSFGNNVNERIYYQTPSNRVFNRAKLYQGFGGNSYFSHGYYLDGSNNTVGYFGRHDRQGTKIWGGEIPIDNVNDLVLNREGTFVVSVNGFESSISRFTKDSMMLWKVSLGTGLPFRFVNGLYFIKSDTGLVYGYSRQQGGNLGNQFWIAKIAGVGTAYDPSNPQDTVTVSAEERLFRPKDAPILFPNPITEHIQFTKLTQNTQLAIYSTTGVKLMEKTIQPEECIDVCQLPKGVYLYHLKMGEKVFTGKFLKR
jgi:hypothetical protein